uniref:Uncharacterized protein n=1 Tax=Eutreptiella gymnastica TaxID=73025 RepID=A0A7S4FZ38_9EUGL
MPGCKMLCHLWESSFRTSCQPKPHPKFWQPFQHYLHHVKENPKMNTEGPFPSEFKNLEITPMRNWVFCLDIGCQASPNCLTEDSTSGAASPPLCNNNKVPGVPEKGGLGILH